MGSEVKDVCDIQKYKRRMMYGLINANDIKSQMKPRTRMHYERTGATLVNDSGKDSCQRSESTTLVNDSCQQVSPT